MSLFGALNASANSLEAFSRALAVTQNNVTNANTPGYVRQRPTLLPKLFDPAQGVAGGVAAGSPESGRRDYTERAVRRQNSLAGRFSELLAQLTRLEGAFDPTGTKGLPRAINRLFEGFSALAVGPNDLLSRQGVLDRAGDVAREFQAMDAELARAQQEAVEQSTRLVGRIQALSERLRGFNTEIRSSRDVGDDPGIDAEVYSTLEELSALADIQALQASDGTLTVLLGGQTPLVIGQEAYALSASFDGAEIRLTDAGGHDVTEVLQGGRLRGVLDAANTHLPAWRQELNRLAAGLADAVNVALANGVDQNGVPGAALFSYALASNAAGTLEVAPILPEQLAAASAAAPGGNANALDLAALIRDPQLDGLTFPAFYARLAAGVGQEISRGMQNRETASALLVQARELRHQESGVSLDEEAARLIELQRAYQATARLVTVLDSLTETTINMLR